MYSTVRLWSTSYYFSLHSNLYGKRPADYAVSEEMLEIFQEASKGTQYANAHTAHSPSASLSVVRLHENVNKLSFPLKLQTLQY